MRNCQRLMLDPKWALILAACIPEHLTNGTSNQHLQSFARPPIKPHFCELLVL